MRGNVVILAVFIVLIGVVVFQSLAISIGMPEKAHFSVPAGVTWYTVDYEECPGYTVFHLVPLNGHVEAIAVKANDGYYVSKAGVSYPIVMVLPGEIANIRRLSDGRVVSAAVNDSHVMEEVRA